MTSNDRRKWLNRFSLRVPPHSNDEEITTELGLVLQAAMQPAETGEPWIAAEDVAKRVSRLRRRRCSVQEVNAALHGHSIPAEDVVSAALELRSEQRREDTRAGASGRRKEQRAKVLAQALDSRATSDGKRSQRAKHLTEIFRKKTAWAIGIVIAAMLTFLATNVIPNATSNFVSKLRDSPAILVSENVYHANGLTAPFPAVLTGDYHPSATLVETLAQPMGAGSPSYLRLEQAQGISVQNMLIHLLVTSNSGEPVRILNVELSSLHRARPIGGVLFDMGAQGEADNIQMGFNFDKLSPQAMELNDAGRFTNRPFFLAHSISLSKSEQTVLSVEAYTACYGVAFDLAIDYAVGNNDYTEIVTNHGRPFQITARSAKAQSYSEVFTLQNNYSALPLGPAGMASYFDGVRRDQAICPGGAGG